MVFLYEADLDEAKRYSQSISDNDNILDPVDFKSLILALNCNYPKEKITADKVWKEFFLDLEIKLQDAKFLLELCMDKIIEEARK
jgi:hypothetical protein